MLVICLSACIARKRRRNAKMTKDKLRDVAAEIEPASAPELNIIIEELSDDEENWGNIADEGQVEDVRVEVIDNLDKACLEHCIEALIQNDDETLAKTLDETAISCIHDTEFVDI